MFISNKTIFAALLISIAPLACAVGADTFTLDAAHTRTIFTSGHLGFSTIIGVGRDLKGTLTSI